MNAIASALRHSGWNSSEGQRALLEAMRPWKRQLLRERLGTWLIRGAIVGLLVAIGTLLVGWLSPIPETELRPWAAELALIPLAIAAVVGVLPRRHVREAAELDLRLAFGDRLATAWAFRDADQPIVRLQRVDALQRLTRGSRSPSLRWRPARLELTVLGAVALVVLLLLITPSPQQHILDRQAAEQAAVLQASQRVDALRQATAASSSLTPDQARQLDELLRQAQADLKQAQTQDAATAILARTQDQVSQQLGDPNAELRDEALAAMSETLAAEPRTQALASALQQENAQATSQAIGNLSAQADQLSDVERQALSRALQRAANVGRADAPSSNALRDASQAIASGADRATTQAALDHADAALRDAIRASQSQATVNATAQQLHDLQTRLAAGTPLDVQPDASGAQGSSASGTAPPLADATPVALDSGLTSQTVAEPSAGQNTAQGAGVGAATANAAGQSANAAQAAENVYVPGRPGNGQSDQDLVEQPFSVSGAPRPYRDVLSQYANSGRDYVDRPDISPAVRDLVKQYFQELEKDQG